MKNPQNNSKNNPQNHRQNNPIFREESLERLSSPERLDLFGNNSTNDRK